MAEYQERGDLSTTTKPIYFDPFSEAKRLLIKTFLYQVCNILESVDFKMTFNQNKNGPKRLISKTQP